MFFNSLRDGSGLRTIGGGYRGGVTPLESLDSAGKVRRADTSVGKWNRLEDDCSSRGIIVQEQIVNVESESLSDVETAPTYKKHEKFAV